MAPNHHHKSKQQSRHHRRRMLVYSALLGVPCLLLAWTWRTNIRGIALLDSHQVIHQQNQRQQQQQPHDDKTKASRLKQKQQQEQQDAEYPLSISHSHPEQLNKNKLQQQPQLVQERVEKEIQQPVASTSSQISQSSQKPPKFHLVFSTGCSIFQDWQSYVFFYHVLASGQKDCHVTRIASGCNDEEAEILRKQHEDTISSKMSPNYHLHLTRDYSKIVPGDTYKFFNKPYGLRDWMENALGFPREHDDDEMNDTIFIIFDPDQFLIRPFAQDFSNEPELWAKRLRTNTTTGAETSRRVERGRPMGARYAFGGGFIDRINITDILNSSTTPSPVRTWTTEYVDDYFSIGPPYLAVGYDMYRIVKTWSDFVVPIYHQTNKGFMAEMYAYSTAAVHLNLPHTTSRSFMISDPSAGLWNEAWEWFDHLESKEVCSRNITLIPHVIHYCQRYFLGPYFFSKYQLPKGSGEGEQFLSCSHGLFHEPPLNVGDLYNTSVTLDWTHHDLNPTQRLRMAFLLCQILPRINDASTFYKDHHCASAGASLSTNDNSTTRAIAANYSKTFFFSKHKKKG